MKKIFRYVIAFLVVFPFSLFIFISMAFISKEKAVSICGPFATSIAKAFLKIILPNVKSRDDFGLFRDGAKQRFWLWRPLYDFEIEVENENMLKLNIRNCPFCELLTFVRLKELNRYVCQGDWEFANDNRDKWLFERNHEIGKGDYFCDHTYKRIIY